MHPMPPSLSPGSPATHTSLCLVPWPEVDSPQVTSGKSIGTSSWAGKVKRFQKYVRNKINPGNGKGCYYIEIVKLLIKRQERQM